MHDLPHPLLPLGVPVHALLLGFQLLRPLRGLRPSRPHSDGAHPLPRLYAPLPFRPLLHSLLLSGIACVSAGEEPIQKEALKEAKGNGA